jgi:hypothetical protein
VSIAFAHAHGVPNSDSYPDSQSNGHSNTYRYRAADAYCHSHNNSYWDA